MYYAKAIYEERPPYPITAVFVDGEQATYTSAVLFLLVSDPTVDRIIDNETAEILFHR